MFATRTPRPNIWFHFTTHKEPACLEYCNPERRDNPILWEVDEAGQERFLWNSAIAESNNSFLSALGPVIKRMPRVLGTFCLFMNMVVHNELLLAEKLNAKHPLVR